MNWELLASIFFRLLFFATFVLFCFLMYVFAKDPIIKRVRRLFKIFKSHRNLGLQIILKYIYIFLRKHSQAGLVEFILNSFCWFYELNFVDMEENWAFPEEYFPNGKKDLTDLYKWIKKIRVDNYSELENLDFDNKNNCFLYWKVKYKSLKHKITPDGVLKIIPIEYMESEHMDRIFQIRLIKIQEDLARLDTEKVTWIIERRKFFLV